MPGNRSTDSLTFRVTLTAMALTNSPFCKGNGARNSRVILALNYATIYRPIGWGSMRLWGSKTIIDYSAILYLHELLTLRRILLLLYSNFIRPSPYPIVKRYEAGRRFLRIRFYTHQGLQAGQHFRRVYTLHACSGKCLTCSFITFQTLGNGHREVLTLTSARDLKIPSHSTKNKDNTTTES